MRKLVYGALALSAALAVGFGVNANDADAANGYTTSWEATQKGDSLTLKAVGKVDDITKPASTIFVGEPKFAKRDNTDEGKTIAKATVATWEYYTANNGTAVVDLSKYAVGKDKWLLVKADFDKDSEAVLVKIPAASVLKTVKYVNGDLGAGKITVKDAAGDYTSTKLVAYTENGEEKALSEVSGTPGTYTVADIKDFQVNGASLYVREKGTDTVTAVTPAEQAGTVEHPLVEVNASTKYKEVQVDGVKVKCITTLGARQSAAKKVSVTKLGNAPKLTVDYETGKFTIKAGQKYKIVKGTVYGDNTKVTKAVAEGVSLDTAKLLSAKKDLYIGTDFTSSADFAIDIQTVKTDSKGVT
ncbi:MAG: hypothetical protein IJ733_17485, partial [Lachnospiraceae bacterium]|nr:hypothetical protein [Lachnospiraceae bacterium]